MANPEHNTSPSNEDGLADAVAVTAIIALVVAVAVFWLGGMPK